MGVGFNAGFGQVSSNGQTYISLSFGKQICVICYLPGDENKGPTWLFHIMSGTHNDLTRGATTVSPVFSHWACSASDKRPLTP